jgi:hypothetical protein
VALLFILTTVPISQSISTLIEDSFMAGYGWWRALASSRSLPFLTGRNRPILLKNSAMVCASEK